MWRFECDEWLFSRMGLAISFASTVKEKVNSLFLSHTAAWLGHPSVANFREHVLSLVLVTKCSSNLKDFNCVGFFSQLLRRNCKSFTLGNLWQEFVVAVSGLVSLQLQHAGKGLLQHEPDHRGRVLHLVQWTSGSYFVLLTFCVGEIFRMTLKMDSSRPVTNPNCASLKTCLQSYLVKSN